MLKIQHDTGQVYAMKTLKKADVIEKQQVAHGIEEVLFHVTDRA